MRTDDGLRLGPGDPRAAYGLVAAGEANPPMVEFRGHDGRCLSVPYSRLLSIELRPDRGMALEFPDHQITVRGRNLRVLYEALTRHRVTYVQEGDIDTVPEDDPFVDRIVIGPVDAELS